MSAEWVQFWSTLCEGRSRGITRAERFILMELSLKARPGHGVIDLPVGMTDEDAMCDILGGDRAEVLAAVSTWTAPGQDGDAPTLVFAGPLGARAAVLPRWGEYNSTKEKKSRVSARVRRLRARKDALLASSRSSEDRFEDRTRTVPARGCTSDLPLFSSPVLDPVPEKTDVTGSRAREQPPALRVVPPHGQPPVPKGTGPEALELLAALQSHPALQSVANVRLAEELAGRAIHMARPLAGVVEAISDAARDAGAEAAAGGPIAPAQLGKMVAKYADRAARAGPRSGPRLRVSHLQPAAAPGNEAYTPQTGREWFDELGDLETADAQEARG